MGKEHTRRPSVQMVLRWGARARRVGHNAGNSAAGLVVLLRGASLLAQHVHANM